MPPKQAAKAAPKAAASGKADAKPKAKPKPKKVEEDEGPKPQQPDRAAFEESVKKVSDTIQKLQEQQGVLAKKIAERSTGKEDYASKRAEIRARLDEVQARVDALSTDKEKLYQQIGEKTAEAKEQKQQLNKMKGSMKYSSEEDIDKRIADIEFQMWTSSLALKDEKKCLAEIAELKRSKPKLTKLQRMEEQVSGNQDLAASKDQMRESARAISGTIKEALEEKRAISAELTKLNEERQKKVADMPEIFEERQNLSAKIQEKIAERNALRDAFRQQEREFNNYLAEQRKKRAEQAAEARAERQAEYDERRKARAIEQLDEQPHLAEITLIEQTISWCQNTMPKEKEEATSEKKDTTFNNPEGSMILLKKDDREEEFFFAPTKKKAAKGKQAKKDDTKIKHNAATFKLFDALKLDAPLTTEEIPGILEKLEEQLKMYQEKVKKWELTREEQKRAIMEGKVDEKEEKDDEEKKDDAEEEKEEE